MTLPDTLVLNAWTGEAAADDGTVSPHAKLWAKQALIETPQLLAAEEPPSEKDWTHAKVGWGLLLPEYENLTPQQLSTAAGAPAPIQRLHAERSAKMGSQSPVFRYRDDLGHTHIRRYLPNGNDIKLEIATSKRGLGLDALPFYLLIYGNPVEIPWRYQYALNGNFYVGRLDLKGDQPGEPLCNYVDALLADWKGAASRREAPVIWSVNHGQNDITFLMRSVVALPVRNKFKADAETSPHLKYLTNAEATAPKLVQTLAAQKPGFILTTSHGMTGPLSNIAQMEKQLGFLVDHHHALLDPASLLGAWQPDGAVWYAHACCSAGSDNATKYGGLIQQGTNVHAVLNGVAQVGAKVAPLPRALLGAQKPLRAFIGHVEPTFNWTLRSPETGQRLTHALENALYPNMYFAEPEPVGMAFRRFYDEAGELFKTWSQDKDFLQTNDDPEIEARLIFTKLSALDRQSQVILGDPTAVLPSV